MIQKGRTQIGCGLCSGFSRYVDLSSGQKNERLHMLCRLRYKKVAMQELDPDSTDRIRLQLLKGDSPLIGYHRCHANSVKYILHSRIQEHEGQCICFP